MHLQTMEAVYNGHDVFMWLWEESVYQALPTSSSLLSRPPTRKNAWVWSYYKL